MGRQELGLTYLTLAVTWRERVSRIFGADQLFRPRNGNLGSLAVLASGPMSSFGDGNRDGLVNHEK